MPVSGYIQDIDALACGHVLHKLGAGRTVPEDSVDHGVGLYLLKVPGEHVEEGWYISCFKLYIISVMGRGFQTTKYLQL